MSSSVRAVLSLALLMCLATVLSATAVLLDLRQRELDDARTEIVSLSRIIAEQTTRTFEGVALVLQSTQERLSDDFGRRLELSSFPVHMLLRTRVGGLPQVKSIFVVDRQGMVVNSSRPDLPSRMSVADRDYFVHFAQDEGNDLFITPPSKAKIDGQWTAYAGRRLVDSEGQFRGVVVAAISIDYFESLYGSIGLDFISRIMLLSDQGMLMAGRPHDDSQFGKRVGHTDDLAGLKQRPGGGVKVVDDEVDGQARIVAYRQVDKYPLVIVAAVDQFKALAPWRRTVWPVLTGVALVLLFLLATTWFMVRNMLREQALASALQESDERIRQLVQSAMDVIVTVDEDMSIVLFNCAAETRFGVSARDVLGRPITRLLDEESGRTYSELMRSYLASGARTHVNLGRPEIIGLRSDGQQIPFESSFSGTIFRGRVYLTSLLRDVSERRRSERELRETNRQLEELSDALQNAREEERAWIARELHDQLGQLLTGMKFELSWLARRLPPELDDLRGKISSVTDLLVQTIASVRRITSALRPLILDDLGLAAAAAWLAEDVSQRTGLSINLNLGNAEPERDGAIATTLFRVIQEALTNITKYAQASDAWISLALSRDQWVLTIVDNGVGFVHSAGRKEGFGLIAMRERVRILGGAFAISSAPGQGTQIDVSIPVESDRKNVWKIKGTAGG